jgi:phosphoglycolate phosphatase-like HAD superfamily hydrolase
MIDVAIFDLDGTLADCSHRLHFIKKDPKDWDAFYAAMVDDPPVEAVMALCRSVALYSDPYRPIGVVVCTGRPERYRRETQIWLIKQFIPVREIHMRQDGDRRDDPIIKREMLAEIRKRYRPILAVEDRTRVVAMWRAEGLTCLQCAPGDF